MRSAKEIIAEVVRGTESEGQRLTLGPDAISAIVHAQALDRLTDAVLELVHATRPPALSEAIREVMLARAREAAAATRPLIVPEGVDLNKGEVTIEPVNQKPMSFDSPIKVLGDDDFGNKGE
jgi:hypothetical protein